MAGKSEARKYLELTYPRAFDLSGTTPPACSDIRVVLNDAMQILRGLGKKTNPRTGHNITGRELINAFKRSAESCVGDINSAVKTYVFCFDKYPYTPVAKGVTQRARTKAARPDPVDYEHDMRLDLDCPLPDAWTDALEDRVNGIPLVVRFIVRHMLTEPSCRIGIAPGRSVIIDGHYLTAEDFSGTSAEFVVADHTADCLPIEIFPHQKIDVRWDLKNSIGEGDFIMPYIMAELGRNCKVAVLSVDTDLMWILLRARDKCPDVGPITWRYWPQLTWCANDQLFGPKQQKWCFIDVLRDAIGRDRKFFRQAIPWYQLAVAAVAAGGDYTRNLAKVPHVHWMNAVYQYSAHIGELYDAYHAIEPKAFLRLVKYACHTKARAMKKCVPVAVAERDDLTDAAPYMPSEKDCYYRLLNARYYMKYLLQAGSAVVQEAPPLDYGFCRTDRAHPLSVRNISYLTEENDKEEAPDSGTETEIATSQEEESPTETIVTTPASVATVRDHDDAMGTTPPSEPNDMAIDPVDLKHAVATEHAEDLEHASISATERSKSTEGSDPQLVVTFSYGNISVTREYSGKIRDLKERLQMEISAKRACKTMLQKLAVCYERTLVRDPRPPPPAPSLPRRSSSRGELPRISGSLPYPDQEAPADGSLPRPGQETPADGSLPRPGQEAPSVASGPLPHPSQAALMSNSSSPHRSLSSFGTRARPRGGPYTPRKERRVSDGESPTTPD